MHGGLLPKYTVIYTLIIPSFSVQAIGGLSFVILGEIRFQLLLVNLLVEDPLFESYVFIFEFNDQVQLGAHVFHPLLLHRLKVCMDLVDVNLKFVSVARRLFVILSGVPCHFCDTLFQFKLKQLNLGSEPLFQFLLCIPEDIFVVRVQVDELKDVFL